MTVRTKIVETDLDRPATDIHTFSQIIAFKTSSELSDKLAEHQLDDQGLIPSKVRR